MGCTPCPQPHSMHWGSCCPGCMVEMALLCRARIGKWWGEAGWAVTQTPGSSVQGPGELQPPPDPVIRCSAGPCRVTPSMAAPSSHSLINGTVGSSPTAWHPLPRKGVQRQVSPSLFPIPSSSIQLPLFPAAPKLTLSRCVMPGRDWCYTGHNLLQPLEHSWSIPVQPGTDFPAP